MLSAASLTAFATTSSGTAGCSACAEDVICGSGGAFERLASGCAACERASMLESKCSSAQGPLAVLMLVKRGMSMRAYTICGSKPAATLACHTCTKQFPVAVNVALRKRANFKSESAVELERA